MYTNRFTLFICSVSAMGGLLFGYDWVVIGGAKPFYELYFGIADSPVLQGVAMTTALVGCLLGAMVAGALADRFGRKPLLMTSAVLFTVSAIGTGLFNDFTLFNIARLVGGVGIGELDGEADVCELQKMYCLKEARGTGAANLLIEAALAFARIHRKQHDGNNDEHYEQDTPGRLRPGLLHVHRHIVPTWDLL